MPSPTSGNKRCQQFKFDKGKRAMPKTGETLMIMYNKKQRSTVCYRLVLLTVLNIIRILARYEYTIFFSF